MGPYFKVMIVLQAFHNNSDFPCKLLGRKVASIYMRTIVLIFVVVFPKKMRTHSPHINNSDFDPY